MSTDKLDHEESIKQEYHINVKFTKVANCTVVLLILRKY